MRKNHETNEQQQGGPLVSMCYSAGTGSSVLDPFPSVVVASLRAVDHRCCTPLLVEWWWWKNPLSRVGHTHSVYIYILYTSSRGNLFAVLEVSRAMLFTGECARNLPSFVDVFCHALPWLVRLGTVVVVCPDVDVGRDGLL